MKLLFNFLIPFSLLGACATQAWNVKVKMDDQFASVTLPQTPVNYHHTTYPDKNNVTHNITYKAFFHPFHSNIFVTHYITGFEMPGYITIPAIPNRIFKIVRAETNPSDNKILLYISDQDAEYLKNFDTFLNRMKN